MLKKIGNKFLYQIVKTECYLIQMFIFAFTYDDYVGPIGTKIRIYI
jgi:hypothetical protein